ncbi:MAG: HAD-IA family hydrolase [Microlunatus sp.]
MAVEWEAHVRPEVGNAVLFWDFDGTLAVRDGRWSGALVEAVRLVDPHASLRADQLRPHLQSGFPWHRPDVVVEVTTSAAWWTRLRPVIVNTYATAGIGSQVANAAVDLLPTTYYSPGSWRLVDDAVEALEQARLAGYRNVILSNHAPELPELVQDLGLSPLIELTITSAAIGAEKPNPLIFQYAIDLARACVERSWMIGDNPVADIAGAETAGLRAVLVGPTQRDDAYPGLLSAVEFIKGQTPSPVNEGRTQCDAL